MTKRSKQVAQDEQEREVIAPPADERIVLKSLGPEHEGITKEQARELFEGVTEPAKMQFLLALSQLGNRSRAARAAGVSPIMPWMWRKDDDSFREAYMKAMDMASHLMEDELIRRSCEGVLEPVFQQGVMVGTIRKYSDTLLIFGLKGAMPEKYAERQKVEHSGSLDVVARLKAARQRALAVNSGKKK